MYASATRWRRPSMSLTLPAIQAPGDAPEEATMLKRSRDGSIRVSGLARAASLGPSATTITTSFRVDTSVSILPQVTPEIVKDMQKLSRYRKKLEKLEARRPKRERLVASRREKVLRVEQELEEALDQQAVAMSATTPESEHVRGIGRQLESSRLLHEESEQKLRSLRGNLMAYETNAKFAMIRLEESLGQLLSGQGLFADSVSDFEASEHSGSRTSERARTESESESGEKLQNPDPDFERKQEAVTRLQEARTRYQEIEANFENRSEMYKDGLENWQRLVAVGDCSMTRTELDVQWCAQYGEMGMDLWEAEIARSDAAVAVMKLKALPTTYSQTSKFADHPEDAEGLENETRRAVATLDTERVQKWLDAILKGSSAEQPAKVEPDDWEIQSLQFGESCSGIAEGWIKIRLDRWNQMREEDWTMMKDSMGEHAELPTPDVEVGAVKDSPAAGDAMETSRPLASGSTAPE